MTGRGKELNGYGAGLAVGVDARQRENVAVLGLRTDVLVGVLVWARSMPGRPIPDALIAAASLGANALPLATFDRGQARYGIAVREP